MVYEKPKVQPNIYINEEMQLFEFYFEMLVFLVKLTLLGLIGDVNHQEHYQVENCGREPLHLYVVKLNP
jgi:hypothetical protein